MGLDLRVVDRRPAERRVDAIRSAVPVLPVALEDLAFRLPLDFARGLRVGRHRARQRGD